MVYSADKRVTARVIQKKAASNITPKHNCITYANTQN